MDEVLDQMIESNIQPKPLNLFQKAIKKNKEQLKDGVPYEAELVRVESYETKKGVPVLSYVYDINGVEVTDNYFFSEFSMQMSIDRLMSTLKKFNFELNIMTADDGVESIRYNTKYLIGSKVKLVQNTRRTEKKDFYNYEVVEVLNLKEI